MGKPAPQFWWDFSPAGSDSIIVQGDYPGGEELARFTKPAKQPEDIGLEPQIAAAEALIADFRAGRKTPKWVKRTNNNHTPPSPHNAPGASGVEDEAVSA